MEYNKNDKIVKKYGFKNMDRASLTTDGHCWCFAIDLMKCKKEKTGDQIELHCNVIGDILLSCVADIYKIVIDDSNDFKYSGLPLGFVLYVAIGQSDKDGRWGYLVSNENNSFQEAVVLINKHNKENIVYDQSNNYNEK